MPTIGERFKNGWNAFFNNKDPTEVYKPDIYGMSSYNRPDRMRFRPSNEKSIVNAVFNKIAIDVASIQIQHVRTDGNGRYIETIDSGLNNVLTLDANIDQTGMAFIIDVVESMFDEGCVAMVPIDTDIDPRNSSSFDILTMRTGKVLEWFPSSVRLEVYNERMGRKQELIMPKSKVAIIENPFYPVMNEPNATVKRLIRKLNLLDLIDEQSGSSKLDLIISLPYIVKTETQKAQAEARKKSIEMQLADSKYGIAYTDGTEKITQLNRSVDNNLLNQIEYLTGLMYNQLGLTEEIMKGTADEAAMLNYYNRTVEPILSAITMEMKRKFLTKTARTQKQSIMYFRDPFKLVPINNIADIADKFTRNEILSSNEIRGLIGFHPVNDDRANELRNKNINQAKDGETPVLADQMMDKEFNPETANADLDQIDAQLNELEAELMHYASPYYDPEKAHEYYMKNRELKNRKSTASLNEEGREHANYIKEQLYAERNKKIQESKDKLSSDIATNNEQSSNKIKSNSEKLKSDIANNYQQLQSKLDLHKQQTMAQIDQLKIHLKNLSADQRKNNQEAILEQINKLREDNAGYREEVTMATQEDNQKLSESTAESNANVKAETKTTNLQLKADQKQYVTDLKAKYEDMYLDELDALKNSHEFDKSSAKSNSSSGSRSSSSPSNSESLREESVSETSSAKRYNEEMVSKIVENYSKKKIKK